MDDIGKLRASLVTALSPRTVHWREQELFDELFLHHGRLLQLSDFTSKSGKAPSNAGRDPNFDTLVTFLANQLDGAEDYVSTSLRTVRSGNPNNDLVVDIEATVDYYHRQRRQLLDCLVFIFEAAELALSPNAGPLYHRLAQYAKDNLINASVGTTSFASNILKQLDIVAKAIAKTTATRQNAVSDTTLPTPQGVGGGLGADILSSRLESLNYERRSLATVLALIARSGALGSAELQTVINSLESDPENPIAFYSLSTVLAAFDVVQPDSSAGKLKRQLVKNSAFVKFIQTTLDVNRKWKNNGLKSVILLKWALLLTDLRHNDQSLENEPTFRLEELETSIWNAIQGDAFVFMIQTLAQTHKGECRSSFAKRQMNIPEQDQARQIPTTQYRTHLDTYFEHIVRCLITYASSELRKIKQRQEDSYHSNSRNDRLRNAPKASDQQASTAPRNDVALFFSLIGLIYSVLPAEKALQFWGAGPHSDAFGVSYLEEVENQNGRLPSFLQWAVWTATIRDLDMSTALYDMLSGLANGQQCSELAYNFMARGTGEVLDGRTRSSSTMSGPIVSWRTVFGILESWDQSRNAPPQTSQQSQGPSSFNNSSSLVARIAPQQRVPQIAINPKEVLFAESFLRLLAVVVTQSTVVRNALFVNANIRAIPTMMALIPLPVPLEIKGHIFDTISAFCEPESDSQNLDICKTVWSQMEKFEVINVRPVGPHSVAIKGVEVELDAVEAPYKEYPSTLPFLKLLATLIYTPKRLKHLYTDRSLPSHINETFTFPDGLGVASNRRPGLDPYVNFVIDTVFAKIPSREFTRQSDRWLMNDLCLTFVERTIASYDLESLLTTPENIALQRESLSKLLIHPGYNVMSRLLTNNSLQNSILTYLVDGHEGFQRGLSNDDPGFRSSITRVLRIVLRLLQTQDLFIDVLVPIAAELDKSPSAPPVPARSSFIRFDHALSFTSQYVPAIATYVTYQSWPELVLLSVKIMALLSAAPTSTSLMSLVIQSAESERIVEGYRQALEIESYDSISNAEVVAEQYTGAGAPDHPKGADLLPQAIRVAILDFFSTSTESTERYPNIAHFLLFGSSKKEFQIQASQALGHRRTSVHVILDLLNAGVPRLKSRQNAQDIGTALYEVLPALAERCYRVIHNLCVHPRTSESTMRYLRTSEDFFVRHLAAVTSRAPEDESEPSVEIQYSDGTRTISTVSSLTSYLRLHSYIMDMVALELHVGTSKGQFRGVTDILEVLFGHENDEHEVEDDWDDTLQRPIFRELGQSYLRIIEMVNFLNFDWSDSSSPSTSLELQLLSGVNFQSCVRTDAFGCEIVDRDSLSALLISSRHSLHARGQLHAEQSGQLQNEINYILDSCIAENNRRQVEHAKARGFGAWRRLTDTALTKCFARLAHDKREGMVFDLLHALPSIIKSPAVQESAAVVLSEALLSCMTKLREDHLQQTIIQSIGGEASSGSLPAERLFALLRDIVDCILDNNRLDLVRGNLYAAVISYFNLISSVPSPTSTEVKHESFDSSFRRSALLSASASSRSLSLVAVNGPTSTYLEKGSLHTIRNNLERLVATVSRDAIDGAEVWRTIAFMLLDSLVNLSRLDKPNLVFAALSRQGILGNFVLGLKDSDASLQSILKPDPDDLNSLYVYEAKMSLLIRMAHSRLGAERLLDAQILTVLSRCDFIDARPESDHDFMDQDSFLPSAIQCHHQILMPALQLISAILTTLGESHTTAMQQVLDCLSSHRDTFVILLKSSDDSLSLSVVEEMHLLITLCAYVLPLVPIDDLKSPNTGFGALHSAVLALTSKSLHDLNWLNTIRPQTDSERSDAAKFAFADGSTTKFDLGVVRRGRLLRKALIQYLGAASRFTESQITPMLTATTSPSRIDPSSRFVATNPTLGDALTALGEMCEALTGASTRIRDLAKELAARDHIRVDTITEIVDVPDERLLRTLNTAQKRALIAEEYQRRIKGDRADAKVILESLEMILLLLWRHFGHFGTTGKARPESLSPLYALEDVDLDLWEDKTGSDQYIDVMARKLKEVVGAHEASTN